MNINKENIESYLLDLSEGNLSPAQIEELQLFVLVHPEYAELLEEAIDLPTITVAKEKFKNKAQLKRYTFESTDLAFARELEGDLSDIEKAELQDILTHHPELHIERARFALTVLQPEQINYPHKEQLRRRTGRPVLS
jgi:hypothetical protein